MAPCCCCGSPSWWWCRPAPMPSAMLGVEVLGRPLRRSAATSPPASPRCWPSRWTPSRPPCAAPPGTGALAFDALLHRPAGGGLILELERPGAAPDLSRRVERALQAILSTYAPRMLCEETARHLPRHHRLRPGHGLSLRRRRPWRGGGRAAAGRPRTLSRQPLPGLRHPADRPPALRCATASGCWSISATRRCRWSRGSRRSPAATSTCRCVRCAASRRCMCSTCRTWASARRWSPR